MSITENTVYESAGRDAGRGKTMADKNTVEVVIDGKIYQLSGAESEVYLQQVASYLNGKITSIKREVRSYGKLDDSLKALLLEINICDDYFRQQAETRKAKTEMDDPEREAYSAKHDLINMQMKLEGALKQLEETQKAYAELAARNKALELRNKGHE